MYRVTCDNYPLLDLRKEELILINPKVNVEVNTVGEGSFTIYDNHPHYDKLKKLKSVVEVSDENGVIFRGRITNNTTDFYKGKAVDLEGAMAFFNDSIISPYAFPDDFLNNADYKSAAASGNVVAWFLKWLIEQHNSQVQEFQKFKLGTVTVADPNNYITRSDESCQKTWDVLKNKLFDSALGGYLCIRYEEDGNYIDYLSEFTLFNTQEIIFGKNLLDLKNDEDTLTTYSAIIPFGAEVEVEVGSGEETTTSSVKTTLGSIADGAINDDIYKITLKNGLHALYSKKAVEEYGWICAPVEETTWEDVTDTKNLLTKSTAFLEGTAMKLSSTKEITAADLHFTDEEIHSFRIYKKVLVLSLPHGLSEAYDLTRLEIPLLSPQDTKIIVGDTKKTLIDKQNASSNTVMKKIQTSTSGLEEKVAYVEQQVKDLDGLYFYIRYSPNANGIPMTEDPADDTVYMGTCSTMSPTAPEEPEDYIWCRVKGNDGIQGESGIVGVGVSSSEVYYYLSDSNTSLTGGEWVILPPAWVDGKYYWQKIITTYTDKTSAESKPVCITGAKGETGEKGEQGIQGEKGDKGDTGATGASGKDGSNGVGVSSIITQFYLSTSKTTQTGGSWVTTMPTWSSGKYLWTRSKITYTDNTIKYTSPICDSSWEVANDVSEDLKKNYSTTVQMNSAIEKAVDEIKLSVSQTYETKSNVADIKTELQSSIKLNADNITAKVSKGEVSSQLSLETGKITLSGNRIVIDSTNFHVSEDGTITAINGNFNGYFECANDDETQSVKMEDGIVKLHTGAESYCEISGSMITFKSNASSTYSYLEILGQEGIVVNEGDITVTSGNLTVSGNATVSGAITQKGYRVMNAASANGFWGLATPDGDSSTWIRTTISGIIPYQSGASSSIGTSTWRFNYGYFNTLDVNAIHYARNNINITSYGTGIIWNNTYGTTGINNLSSGEGVYLYTVNSGSSGWSSSIMLANKDGVNLVPKTGGTFTGNLGIGGTLTIGSQLLVNNSKIQSTSTYNSTTSTAANLIISSAGWFNRSTASSRRYKHDIENLSGELNSERLLSVPIRQYKFNEDYISKDDQRYNVDVPGFIAEELYEYYPIAVEMDNGVVEDWNHRMIIPPMLDLIQKLYKRIEELERKVSA